MGEKPTKAIVECLDEAGITLDEVEVVAVGWDEPVCMAQNGEPYDPEAYRRDLLPMDSMPRLKEPPIQFVPHHLAHAASGVGTSGSGHAAILVIDGRGETQSTSLGVASRDGIEWLEVWDISQSLGNYYGNAADWAGFTFWGSGKLMGLASYGRPEQSKFLVPTSSGYRFEGSGSPTPSVKDQENQHLKLAFDHYKSLYPFTNGDAEDVMAHANFAASIQADLEEAVLQLARVAK
jgi:carbamoyltransferase